jgi:signal transduction histidine kinase
VDGEFHAYEVTVLVSRSRVRYTLASAGVRLTLGLLVALMVALVAGLGLVALTVRPLNTLADQARTFGTSRRAAVHFSPGGSREVADLARALRSMGARLAEQMRGLSSLASGIAHDFNNLLAAIQVHVELVERDPEAAPEAASAIRDLARQGEELVQEILLYAQRETTPPGRLDLAALLRDQEPVLGHLMGDGVELVLEVPDRPVPVSGSPVALRRMLLNLVLNARDALVDGSGRVGVRLVSAGDEAKLEVEDNGVGISKADQERLFEPFFSARSDREGVGLGLAVVATVVSDHDGRVEVDSEPGRGTRILVVLPLVETGGEIERPLEDRHSLRVLVVEGDGRRATALIEALAAASCSVRHVLGETGNLGMGEGWRPDVVVRAEDGTQQMGEIGGSAAVVETTPAEPVKDVVQRVLDIFGRTADAP